MTESQHPPTRRADKTKSEDIPDRVELIGTAKDQNPPVLIIYTGGLNGLKHNDLMSKVSQITELPFAIDLCFFDPFLTPSNITPRDWVRIGKTIEKFYKGHQGFVVLHDVDTITYTAAALSFMLEHLAKPVILTGIGASSKEAERDFSTNIVNSLKIAAHDSTNLPIVPEVCVFFGDALIRGNRARCVDSVDNTKFESPFYPKLGEVNDGYIKIHENFARKASTLPLLVHDISKTEILSFDIFPGIPLNLLNQALEHWTVKGMILKTFGPEYSLIEQSDINVDFLNVVKKAQDKGIVVVNITGHSMKNLEEKLPRVHVELLDKGALTGLDMTPEAALCKLMLLLGECSSNKEVAAYMQTDRMGEQSVQIFNLDYGPGDTWPGKSGQEQKIPGVLETERVYRAMFRMRGLAPQMTQKGSRCITKVFLNQMNANVGTPETTSHFVGRDDRIWNGGTINLDIDATDVVQHVVNPSMPVSSTVVTNQKLASWNKMRLEIYAYV